MADEKQDRRELDISMDVDRIFLKHLKDERLVTWLTGRGRCNVCGGWHESREEWKRCAQKRAGVYSRKLIPIPLWPLRAVGLDTRWVPSVKIEVDPVLLCLITESEGDEIEAEISSLIGKIGDHLLKVARERILAKVIEYSKRLGIEWSDLIEKEDPRDIVGHFYVRLMRKGLLKVTKQSVLSSGPFVGRITWVVDDELAPLKKGLEGLGRFSVMYGFGKWLSRKAGLVGDHFWVSSVEGRNDVVVLVTGDMSDVDYDAYAVDLDTLQVIGEAIWWDGWSLAQEDGSEPVPLSKTKPEKTASSSRGDEEENAV